MPSALLAGLCALLLALLLRSEAQRRALLEALILSLVAVHRECSGAQLLLQARGLFDERVYRFLRRLHGRGLLCCRSVQAPPPYDAASGYRLQYLYRLTESGRDAARSWLVPTPASGGTAALKASER